MAIVTFPRGCGRRGAGRGCACESLCGPRSGAPSQACLSHSGHERLKLAPSALTPARAPLGFQLLPAPLLAPSVLPGKSGRKPVGGGWKVLGLAQAWYAGWGKCPSSERPGLSSLLTYGQPPKKGGLLSGQAGYHGNAQPEVPPSAPGCSFHPEKTLLVLGSSSVFLLRALRLLEVGGWCYV